jgi:hypothetical protein
MKNKTLKKMLLPIGLLIMGSSYLLRFFEPSAGDIEDFIKGLGFAFVLSALFFISRYGVSHPSNKTD